MDRLNPLDAAFIDAEDAVIFDLTPEPAPPAPDDDRDIVTVTTNVPGPQQPLYGMGRRALEIIPYVPIATALRTGVSIFSYDGHVAFGITGDFAASPDLDVLAHGIEDGLRELLKAARG